MGARSGRRAWAGRSRSAVRGALGLALGCSVFACATMRAGAPFVTPEVLASAREQGFDEQGVVHGRALYAASCAHCHASPRVSEFSMAEWEEILPRMARRSAFDVNEAADVRAFVLAVERTTEATTTSVPPVSARAP